jgi:hypothetical protein
MYLVINMQQSLHHYPQKAPQKAQRERSVYG